MFTARYELNLQIQFMLCVISGFFRGVNETFFPSWTLRGVDWQLGTDVSEQPTVAIILVIRVRQWELDYQAGKSRVSKRVTVEFESVSCTETFIFTTRRTLQRKYFQCT